MDAIINILLILLLSVIGWKVFDQLSLPAPKVIGPMTFILIANLCNAQIAAPGNFRTILAVTVGIIVGLQFNVKIDGHITRQLMLSCTWMILTGVIISAILMGMGIERDTAVFAALPGGISELTFISMEFQADPFQVALFHSVRMVTMLTVIPMFVRKLPKPEAEQQKLEQKQGDISPSTAADWIIITALSAGFTSLLLFVHFPVGTFVGPLAATAVYIRRRNIRPKMNKNIRDVTEACVGGIVGTGVTGESLTMIPNLIIPLIILDVLIMLSSLFLGRVLHKVSAMDGATSYLAAAPGGFSPFVVIAGQMNADVSRVAIFHLTRYLSIIIFAIVQGLVVGNL